MKNSGVKKLLLFVLLFPLHLLAQDIAGVWSGTIYNDSTQKFYTYQMVISDDNGKLSGYSYTVYDIDGKPEVGMRDLKIKRKGNTFTVTDYNLIYHNYSEAPPKGIHKVSVLTVDVKDTLMTLKGEWHSNRTKKFSPLSGIIEVQKKYDYKPLEIFKKLEDLKLDQALSFTPKPAVKEGSSAADIAAQKKASKEAEEKRKKEEKIIATAEKEAEQKKEKEAKLIADAEKKAAKEAEEKKKKEEKLIAAAEKAAEQKKEKEAKLIADAEKKAAKEAEEKRVKEEKLIAAKKKESPEMAVVAPPANEVEKRKIVKTQEVFFKSDSLTITLYDNGEVDGDVVTVLMNGEIFMPKVALTTQPKRKTIYISGSAHDSINLVMFAENLGSIPPNTGLLVVNDGEDIYEVRFSADLSTNAAILLRRRK